MNTYAHEHNLNPEQDGFSISHKPSFAASGGDGAGVGGVASPNPYHAQAMQYSYAHFDELVDQILARHR